jgi:hypothetical protein
MSDRTGFSQRLAAFNVSRKSFNPSRNANPQIGLDVALSCGYFDQSHFNHDFRRLSGLTPTEYLQVRTNHHNHLHEL